MLEKNTTVSQRKIYRPGHNRCRWFAEVVRVCLPMLQKMTDIR